MDKTGARAGLAKLLLVPLQVLEIVLLVSCPGELGHPGSQASGRKSLMTVPRAYNSEIGSLVRPGSQVS